jgi:hypothetical protein
MFSWFFFIIIQARNSSCWSAPSNIEIWKNGRMEILKALCASFFNLQSSIAKRLGGEANFHLGGI